MKDMLIAAAVFALAIALVFGIAYSMRLFSNATTPLVLHNPKPGKKRLVKTLIRSVEKALQDTLNSGRVPENWDGIELRQWVAEAFAKEGTTNVKATNYFPLLTGKRLKGFKNDIVVNNL